MFGRLVAIKLKQEGCVRPWVYRYTGNWDNYTLLISAFSLAKSLFLNSGKF